MAQVDFCLSICIDDADETNIKEIIKNAMYEISCKYGIGGPTLRKMECYVNGTLQRHAKEIRNNKKDIVSIICYGKEEQMERNKAIKLYEEGMLCCDGSEKERYTNIYLDLINGLKVCRDEH